MRQTGKCNQPRRNGISLEREPCNGERSYSSLPWASLRTYSKQKQHIKVRKHNLTVNIGKTAETEEDLDLKLTFARSHLVGRLDPIQNQWVPLQVLSSPAMATKVKISVQTTNPQLKLLPTQWSRQKTATNAYDKLHCNLMKEQLNYK